MRKVPVVYSMGKVGSSTLSTSISDANLPCYDIHTLSPEALKSEASKSLQRDEFPATHICLSMALGSQVFANPAKCFYISAVRDPVARNLSAFFQNFDYWAQQTEDTSPDAIFGAFLERYPHRVPSIWFDCEWRKYLNIDIYEYEFDREARYSLYSDQFLLLRIDCRDEQIERVLSEALSKNITLRRANEGEAKSYAALYKRVLEMATYTPDYVDQLYDTRFARHFWTAKELEAMREQWLAPKSG